MTDHKFTDDDVIKALECLSGAEIFCKDCEFGRLEDHGFACKKNVANAALALIKRQKAEIERLQEHYKKKNDLLREVKDLQDEVEHARDRLSLFDEAVANAKAEAIKDFAERLKENETKSCSWCVHSKHGTRSEKCDNFFPTHQRAYCLNYDRWESKIDTLVKEMTEESK